MKQLIGGSFNLVSKNGHLVANFGLHNLPLIRAADQGLLVAGGGFVTYLRHCRVTGIQGARRLDPIAASGFGQGTTVTGNDNVRCCRSCINPAVASPN
jgi:hypothetical protein